MKALPLRAVIPAVAAIVLVVGGLAVWKLGGSDKDAGDDAGDVAADDVDASGAFIVKRNGGWCWFQDERVIVDGSKVLVGTVAGTTRDGSTAGDIEVTTFDLGNKSSRGAVLHGKLNSDDHASPSLLRLADGRYLSAYTTPGKDKLMRWRVSDGAGDGVAWQAEQTLKLEGNVTYSNLSLAPGAEGHVARVFNFYRRGDNSPGFMSAPPGGMFEDHGALLSWTRKSPTFDEKKSARKSEPKPYVQYATRGGVTHFITTEDHPRTYDNSVYHGFIKGYALHDSQGQVLDEDIRSGEPVELTKLTRIYEGNRDNIAWTVDLDVDESGKPFVAFLVQKDGQRRSSKKDLGGEDHRFHYAKFDGKAWQTHEIAYAGSMLYQHEVNYTGLVALVPKNPNVMFLSTNVDPVTGKAVAAEPNGDQQEEVKGRYELYRGDTQDDGKTWKWSALTKKSKRDNIRPVVPEWDGGTLVLWLRGSYKSMSSYDMDVVGMLNPSP